MRSRGLMIILSLFILINISAQETRQNILTAGMSYSVAIPGGDLSDRFGTGFMPGLSLDYILVEKNMVFTAEYQFLFGRNVKENVFNSLLTENGEILGNDGSYARVLLRQRGGYVGLSGSKIIPISHPSSGIKLGLGIGFLQHKIRLQIDSQNVPALSGEYAKGYDRYTAGPALRQIIGYQRVGTNRSMNYSIEFNLTEGFTRSKRPLDFDNQLIDDKSRLDVILGIKVKWFLPIGKYGNPEEIFY